MKKIIVSVFFAAMLLGTMSVQAAPLRGFADMHTHPMVHLGFGGMIVYGAPDIGSLMLAGQVYRGWHAGAKNCNTDNIRVTSLEQALGFDNQLHGGPGFGTNSFEDANNCGDILRTAIIDEMEEKYIFEFSNPGLPGINDHPHHGYPAFTHWPHWSSVTHQQMYWEWIKRSFDGGQRVMVALAINNTLLAKVVNATQFVDDYSSVQLQLTEIESFVNRHSDFMAVARTPADLRRIVESNRMAVILGVETEDFGNLTKRAAFDGELITSRQVDAEIRSLHALGVRYIIPIHFSNTVLGGYAINRDLFALSSKEYGNSFPLPMESCNEGIHFQLDPSFGGSWIQRDLLRTRNLGWIIDAQPTYTPPGPGCGHKNSRGLTPLGRRAIQTMMDMGMMIDIDHMSQLAVDETFRIARTRHYPINSGHNGLLEDDCLSGQGGDLQHCTENKRTRQQYEQIRRLGGMVGVGHGGKATSFVRHYRTVLALMKGPVAIGSDANGLEALPAPDSLAPVSYDDTFPMYSFGRTWDFNVVGFAHYGLFPDFIRSWSSSADPATRMTSHAMDAFMSSAEGFAQMWEKSALRAQVRHARPRSRPR